MTIINTRYKIIRETRNKLSLWLFIIAIAFSIIVVSYTGDLIKIVSQSSAKNLEAASIYASTYLNSYLNGELGTLVSTTLGLAIISVLVAPFTGSSATSLISTHYLVSVRANNYHRFTDSLVGQLFSSISLLQLMTLTSVASLLTLDGGRKEGILYAWASWPILVILSTTFLWVAELLYRKFGETKRLLMLAVTLGVIGLVCFYNQEQASTVFGIGTVYAGLIQGFASFDLQFKILSFVILIALWFLLAFIAYKISQVALAYPDLFAKKDRSEKPVKSVRTFSNPMIQMMQFVFIQIVRNNEIKKPLILATTFGAVTLYFLVSTPSMLSTIVMIVPLIVCLSWGSNIFGIIGNGLPWLFSKPFSIRYMIWSFYSLQLGLSMAMAILMMAPSFLLGRLDYQTTVSFLIAVLTSGLVMNRSALHKSVYNPQPFKSGHRGEAILPPATLISYTLRFALWAGSLGIISFTIESFLMQVQLLGIVAFWTLIRLMLLNYKFQNKSEIRNKIMYSVAYN